jgi:hypothetical protein
MGHHRRRRRGHKFGPAAPAAGGDSGDDSVSQPDAESVSNDNEVENEGGDDNGD